VIEVLWGFFGAVFGAGVAYGAMRQKIAKAAADINGLGKKHGRLTALLIRWADTDQKREQLAQAVEPK
jgi:hypothetical protein